MPETTPTSRFEINRTDGTAFDSKTKLTWKICAEGQSYSDGHCTGNASEFSWADAVQNFGDKGDGWRLPNVDELNSIIAVNCLYPSVNIAIFPDTPLSDFWSASSYVSDTAWFVNFSYNNSSAYSTTNTDYVRLVRGKQWVDPLKEEERKQAALTEKQKQEAELAQEQQKREAEENAYFTCDDKTICDKAFSLTQIYINSTASQKIQLATDTIIETYNPTQDGNIAMRAIRTPGRGSSAIIRLTVTCRVDDRGIFDKLCEMKKLDIYNGFRPYINKMLSN